MQALKDTLIKLSALPAYFSAWKRDVWDIDLDDQMCCGGHECGCRGSTHRDEYEHYRNNPTKKEL